MVDLCQQCENALSNVIMCDSITPNQHPNDKVGGINRGSLGHSSSYLSAKLNSN